MARDSFYDVATQAGAGGSLIALENVEVTVYKLNTDGSRVPAAQTAIYQARTGAAIRTNPFFTTTTGEIYFFADAGEYEIEMVDQVVPKRTGDKIIGWNSAPMAVGGVPANTIAADAGLPYGAISAQAKQQDVPIGGVIDWWRPTSNVPVPEGYVVCDGLTTLTAAQHDFGTGASVVVPDFRNAFILGASITKTDGAAAAGGDAATDAPGIRGSGGSMTHILTPAQGPIRNHTHSGTTGTMNSNWSHTHGMDGVGDHTHGYSHPNSNPAAVAGQAGGVNVYRHGIDEGWGTGGAGSHSHGIHWTDINHTHNFSTGNPVGGEVNGSAHNNMPRYVGLLKIMKVKR